jgi:hypothetical protein
VCNLHALHCHHQGSDPATASRSPTEVPPHSTPTSEPPPTQPKASILKQSVRVIAIGHNGYQSTTPATKHTTSPYQEMSTPPPMTMTGTAASTRVRRGLNNPSTNCADSHYADSPTSTRRLFYASTRRNSGWAVSQPRKCMANCVHWNITRRHTPIKQNDMDRLSHPMPKRP